MSISSKVQGFVFVAATLAAVAVVPAHATPIISIGLQQAGVSGGAISTVSTSTVGVASFSGSYGSFITAISAFGAPAMESGNLNTASLSLSASAAGTLDVYVTVQNLTSPTGIHNFLSSFTSNTFTGAAISVVETTYLSATNALFGGTQIGTATFTSGPVVSEVTTSSPDLPPMFSETARYTVALGSGGGTVNDTINIATVPEPMSMALLGAGLMAIGAVRKRTA